MSMRAQSLQGGLNVLALNNVGATDNPHDILNAYYQEHVEDIQALSIFFGPEFWPWYRQSLDLAFYSTCKCQPNYS